MSKKETNISLIGEGIRNTSLITVDDKTGRLTKEEAKTVRQNKLIESLLESDDTYKDLFASMIERKKEKVVARLKSTYNGIHSNAPIICNGPSLCPFFHQCPLGNGCATRSVTDIDSNTVDIVKEPLFDDDVVFPIGESCIAEKVFLEQRLIDYIKEFDVDPAKRSEWVLINDLALVDLHKQRCINILSGGDKDGEGQDFLKEEKIYDGKTGTLTTRKLIEHPLLKIMDMLDKKKLTILDSLTATRKQKAALAAKFAEVQQGSQLLTDIQKLRDLIAGGGKTTIIDIKDTIEIDP